MDAMSAIDDSTATKRLQASLKLVEQALARAPIEALSAASGIADAGQLSRVRSNQLGAKLREVVQMLHAAGVKCVPADRICVDRAKYEAMVTIASAAMSCPETVRKLTWDEA